MFCISKTIETKQHAINGNFDLHFYTNRVQFLVCSGSPPGGHPFITESFVCPPDEKATYFFSKITARLILSYRR